jgi:hypothetical protein
MKIAYRRFSGAIGLSQLEVGTRGMWLEKRRALLAELRRRGHTVDLVNRMTKFSQLPVEAKLSPEHELLMIEFGSSNKQFYGKDIEETLRMIKSHKGCVVFLCDDPDLPLPWKELPDEDWSRWSVWYNAKFEQSLGAQPAAINKFDMPFSVFQPEHKPGKDFGKEHFAYIGRPNGRGSIVENLVDGGVPFVAYGKTGGMG